MSDRLSDRDHARVTRAAIWFAVVWCAVCAVALAVVPHV